MARAGKPITNKAKAVLSAFLLLAPLAPGCNHQEEGGEAVAWVNGEAIPFSLFWEEIRKRSNEVSETASPQQEVLDVLKRKVLRDLIRNRLLLQEAANRGITVSEEDLEARIQAIRAGYKDTPFRKNLVRHGLDYEEWREGVRENMILEALFASVVQGAPKVTDKEVREYYLAHPDEFLIPEAVQLRQIVVKNRSTALRLLRRLRRGESFEALATKYSIGPERESAGLLGTFRMGELPEPLEKAAFSTPTGKVTSLVETQFGFHILKVVKRIPSHTATLEEAEPEIRRKLVEKTEQAYYKEWVDGVVRNSDIRVHASLVRLLTTGDAKEFPLPLKSEENREP